MDDLISRQAAIEAICKEGTRLERNGTVAMCEIKQWCIDLLERLPSAQPEPAIPLSWIEGQIGWLKGLDNAFSTLSAEQILAMMNKWKDEQDG